MVNAMLLAEYILYTCMKQGEPISNLQLQKILYFIQGKYLAQKGVALFEDDFEAWQYGPVIRSVYSKYCGYGASSIVMVNQPQEKLDKDISDFINPIIQKLRKWDVWSLVQETHEEGGAWDRTFENGKGKYYIIPKNEIKREFLSREH